ncbi:putative eukaryotic translation initiation factor 5 [Favolaschia claudopus]|uniref:Eukaryotic translation initiation factor 5 n=1 Tax=Favolaschia claudopus TaxID=2862362 RepID=A0AAW0DV68_9AGAR
MAEHSQFGKLIVNNSNNRSLFGFELKFGDFPTQVTYSFSLMAHGDSASNSSFSCSLPNNPMLSRRTLIFTAVFLVCQYLLLTHFAQQCYQPPSTVPALIDSSISPSTIRDTNITIPLDTVRKTRHIAVATTYGVHMDVYMSLAWTFQKVLDQSPSSRGSVEVYAPFPFIFDFHTVVEKLALYRGEVKKPDALIEAVNAGEIDVVVLGTCEIDLRSSWGEDLLSAWDARDAAHKFTLVCIVHNGPEAAPKKTIEAFAQRRAIRIMAISDHVAASQKLAFLARADSRDTTMRSAGYEYIPVDVHIPVLNVVLDTLRASESPRKMLSNAVIQGNFAHERRDYRNFFADLMKSLAEDPQVWGYLPLDRTANSTYLADPDLSEPPFQLFLVGSGTPIEVPHELQNIVHTRSRLKYTEFYALMNDMDIVIPAIPATNIAYYDVKASSTFAIALECHVPILVTRRIRNSYTHIDDDRVAVTRPAAMTEVDALRALRTGKASLSVTGDAISENLKDMAREVENMIRRGWVRSAEDFQAVKAEIWRKNEHAVERILNEVLVIGGKR